VPRTPARTTARLARSIRLNANITNHTTKYNQTQPTPPHARLAEKTPFRHVLPFRVSCIYRRQTRLPDEYLRTIPLTCRKPSEKTGSIREMSPFSLSFPPTWHNGRRPHFRRQKKRRAGRRDFPSLAPPRPDNWCNWCTFPVNLATGLDRPRLYVCDNVRRQSEHPIPISSLKAADARSPFESGKDKWAHLSHLPPASLFRQARQFRPFIQGKR